MNFWLPLPSIYWARTISQLLFLKIAVEIAVNKHRPFCHSDYVVFCFTGLNRKEANLSKQMKVSGSSECYEENRGGMWIESDGGSCVDRATGQSLWERGQCLSLRQRELKMQSPGGRRLCLWKGRRPCGWRGIAEEPETSFCKDLRAEGRTLDVLLSMTASQGRILTERMIRSDFCYLTTCVTYVRDFFLTETLFVIAKE